MERVHSRTNQTKSLSIALLLLGILAGTLAGSAAAETVTFTAPAHDDNYYAPGETFTATLGGLNTAQSYDLVIRWKNSTGDRVWIEFNMTPATASITRAIAIPDNWNGSYTFYIYRNATNTSTGSRSFNVRLFTLSAQGDHEVYLPGGKVTVFYFTQRTDDQKSLSDGHGRWRLTVQRDNGSGFVSEDLGGALTDPRGSFNFDLPTTTRPNAYFITIVYNNTNDEHSQTYTMLVDVGSFNVYVYNDRSVYAPGDSVIVQVSASVQGSYNSENVQGAAVTLKVEKYDASAGTWGEDSSFGSRTGTTDVQGVTSFLIPLPATGIPDDTRLRARVSATKAGAPQEATDEFTVRTPTGFNLDLKLDKTTYKPGETVRARLVFTTTNTSLIAGSMYAWTIQDANSGRTFVYELVAGTATGSDRDFVIPSDFTGQLYFYVVIYTPDQNTYSQSDYASVFSYALLVNPSKTYFSPGDTITVNVALVSDRVTSASFYWTVTPNTGGDVLAKGTIPEGAKTGSFTFTIPAVEPADSYSIQVAAEGSGLVATDSASVSRAKFTGLQITIPDKQYKPGDTVPIHYSFVTVGGATPPTTATITVSLSGLAGSSRSFEVDTSSHMDGELQYTIPATAPATGDMVLTASASGAGSSTTTLFVRPSAGSSPTSSAATTASYGVIFAIIGIALAVIALMRKGASVRGEVGSSSTYGGMRGQSPSTGSFKVDEKESPKPADRVMMNDPNPLGAPPVGFDKDKKDPPKSL